MTVYTTFPSIFLGCLLSERHVKHPKQPVIITGNSCQRHSFQAPASFCVFTGHFPQTRIQSCQSQRIQGLPSSTPSSSTPPWRTLSSSTCACWTLTLSLLCRATLASSAPSVGLLNKPLLRSSFRLYMSFRHMTCTCL